MLERVQPFVEESAGVDLSIFWDDSDEWPEGTQLREIFAEEWYGGLRLIEHVRFFELSHDDAVRRITEHLAVDLAFGHRLPEPRWTQAADLAQELVTYFGAHATWRVTYDEKTPNTYKHDRFMSSISGAQYGGLLIGRNRTDVLVMFAVDEEPDDEY